MKLSAAVMAHPARAAMVDELLRWLDRPVPVVWDQVNDRHETGLRALRAFDPDATHHLVIQDDTIPCRDLLASAEQALRFVPKGSPMVLYTGAVRPFRRVIDDHVSRASSIDASWITMSGIYWGPAVVLPTEDLDELCDWYASDGAWVENYDRRMSVWYCERARTCWYTRPSLVDHRGDESLSHPATGVRRAHRFLGAEASGLEVDWSGPVVHVPYSAKMDDARELAAQRARGER